MCYTEAENGRRESDIRSETSENVPARKNLLTMDEAISKTKFGFFNYVIISVTGIILFAVSVETVAIAYVLPVACDMNLTSGQKGALAGASLFGILISSFIWGYLADTKGRRTVILPTLYVAFFISIICSFTQNVYIFIGLRFLNGCFISGSGANVMAYLGEFHKSKHRTLAIVMITVISNGLFVFVSVIAWAVINQDWQFEIPIIDLTYKSWRIFMFLCALPGLMSAIALNFLPESPKFLHSQGNKMEAYQILQKMNRWNNGKDSKLDEFEILEEVESSENKQHISESNNKSRFSLINSVWNQTIPLFKPPYLRPTILLCILQFGVYSVFNGFFLFLAEIINRMSINLNSFVDDRMMMCDAMIAQAVNTTATEYIDTNNEVCIDKLDVSVMLNGAIFELILTVGLAIAGLFLKIVGKFPVIFFILLTTGLSGIGCMFTDVPWLQVVLYIWLMCCGILASILSSVSVDLYPTTMRAMAVSIALMSGRVGSVIGANTVALLLDDNCETSFYLSGSILIVMSVLSYFIPNIHKK